MGDTVCTQGQHWSPGGGTTTSCLHQWASRAASRGGSTTRWCSVTDPGAGQRGRGAPRSGFEGRGHSLQGVAETEDNEGHGIGGVGSQGGGAPPLTETEGGHLPGGPRDSATRHHSARKHFTPTNPGRTPVPPAPPPQGVSLQLPLDNKCSHSHRICFIFWRGRGKNSESSQEFPH